MRAIAEYFAVVLYFDLHAGFNFKSVEKIPKCDHSSKSCWAVLSCGAVYYAVQSASIFESVDKIPTVWPLNWKLLSTIFDCGAVYFAVQVGSDIRVCG